MIDLNEFTDLYITSNKNFVNEKNNILENFRKREEELRNYDELLSEVEKKSIDSHLNSFSLIENKIYNFLLDFNPENMSENIETAQAVISYLETKEHEFSKISEVFLFIKKTWDAFLIRRNLNIKPSIFSEQIVLDLKKLEDDFSTVLDQDISRIEEDANLLKHRILKVISIFEELHILLENNVFIGKEALELKDDIEYFLNNDFYNSPIIDILKRKENISEAINEISSNETEYIKKALPVVKVKNSDKQDLYIYTVKFDDYLLEYQNENLNENNIIIEDTKKFIYIDNYPIKGIFKIDDIKNNMIISESHFIAMDEFDNKSTKMFYLATFICIILTLFSILNVLNIFIILSAILGVCFSFYYSFFKLLNKIEKKHNVKNLFFFIPTNFYLISIGDLNFNYKELIFSILVNANKTILKTKEE